MGLRPVTTVAVSLLASAVFVWALPQVAGEEGSWLPAHLNHTLVHRYYSKGDYGFWVVAVGDVVGSREIILWLELCNHAASGWSVDSATVRAMLDGVNWRGCHYASWSVPGEPYHCADGTPHPTWLHRPYQLGPGSNTTCWMVFQLPKYEFDSMRSLTIEFPSPLGNIVAGISISPKREPEEIPYLKMVQPVDGQNLTWLSSIKFQIYDTDYRPINWSVELDGRVFFEGTAEPRRPDLCPNEIEKKIGYRSIPNGPHRMVVHVSEGRVSEKASVDFFFEYVKTPELQLEWVINISNIFSGLTFGPGHQGCQTVWDIDGDGAKEILFGNFWSGSRITGILPGGGFGQDARLWCFDAQQDLEWIYPPLDEDPLPGPPTSKVSLVDVNNDGIYEICLAGMGGRLHVINPDGSIYWFWDDPNRCDMHGPPQALDVDGDGFVEYFVNDYLGEIHRVSHEGELVWTFVGGPGPNNAPPTICDIDQDGAFEVVWANNGGRVYCVDARDGREEWVFENAPNLNYQPVIVADVNGDHEYEAVFCTQGPGGVFCLSFYGKELWRWNLPPEERILMCQAMGDVDADGSMDMVIMSSSGMFCLDIGGVAPGLKWEVNVTRWSEEGVLPPGATADECSAYQLIADIDGDDRLEVLWLAPFPIVTDAATGELETFYLNEFVGVGGRQENGGWWGDVDGDGKSEWICELSADKYHGDFYKGTRVYCLTLNGRFPARSPWPEYYHSAYPAEYQKSQDWLGLKSAYSNSLWFLIPENLELGALVLLIAGRWTGIWRHSFHPGPARVHDQRTTRRVACLTTWFHCSA